MERTGATSETSERETEHDLFVRATERRRKTDRRHWERIAVAIPVYVRGINKEGEDSLRFATTLNISRGGALLLVPPNLRPSSQVFLEFPSSPLPPRVGAPVVAKTVGARVAHVTRLGEWDAWGLKFTRPIFG